MSSKPIEAIKPKAAIDVGSNAIRLAIGALGTDGRLNVPVSSREPVRLGGDVFSLADRSISSRIMDDTRAAFKRLKMICVENQVDSIRAVGTSALREASNSNKLVSDIRKDTDIEIELIDGAEEARLIYRAVEEVVDLKNKLVALIDIGGGSVETTIARDGVTLLSESARIGAVRLLQMWKNGKDDYKNMTDRIDGYFNGIRRLIQDRLEENKVRVDLCIGTGGNIEALGDLNKSQRNRSDTEITDEDLDSLVNLLKKTTVEERIERFGLRSDRADVILPAALVVRTLVKKIKAPKLIVPRVGLKDGLLLELFPSGASKISKEEYRQHVLGTADYIGKKFAVDPDRALRVSKFATKLFDATKRFHGFDHSTGLLLEVAGRLCDVGEYINRSVDSHQRTLEVLLGHPFIQFNHVQKKIMACVARYHRGAHPKDEHRGYSDLSRDEKETVRKLASLLRIAHALDRAYGRVLDSISASVRADQLIIRLGEGEDVVPGRWSEDDRGALFKEVFGMPVLVKK